MAVINSVKGYLKLNLELQYLHLPLRYIQLKMGIKSKALSFLLHALQQLRGKTKDFFFGNLIETTFKKLPTQAPKINIKTINIFRE